MSFIISISIFKLAVTSGLAAVSEGGVVVEGPASGSSPGVDPGVGLPKKVSIVSGLASKAGYASWGNLIDR